MFQICEKIFAIVGAFIFLQIPQLIEQYEYHLAGHVLELKIHINEMEKSARISGKKLDDYIAKFVNFLDEDVSRQGHLMLGMYQRYQKLLKAKELLQESSIISRPFIFFYYVNGEILSETFHDYRPSLSFSMDSLFYALFGGLIGWLFWRFFVKQILSLFRRAVID